MFIFGTIKTKKNKKVFIFGFMVLAVLVFNSVMLEKKERKGDEGQRRRKENFEILG